MLGIPRHLCQQSYRTLLSFHYNSRISQKFFWSLGMLDSYKRLELEFAGLYEFLKLRLHVKICGIVTKSNSNLYFLLFSQRFH